MRPVPSPHRSIRVPVVTLAAMTVCLGLGWGFTVDDALISTRVAHQLWQGAGYRFNPDGDLVDAVTPLGWAWLLAPFADDPWSGLNAARHFGVVAALGMALLVGYAAREVPVWRWLAVLAPLTVCLPLGAWSVSGMETPLVALLVSVALLGSRAALLGPAFAAALRPECIPLALALAATWPVRRRRDRVLLFALVSAPPLGVALLRLALFGHPAPLSVFAKPSDLTSGLQYVAGGLVLLGLPVLLAGWRSLRALSPHGRALAWASLAHTLALVLAGGDWMALFRLFVPVIPLWLGLASELSRVFSSRGLVLRSSLATALGLVLLLVKGPVARDVWQHREALVRQARPHLSGSFRVAALDVGWVGAATSAPVVDLAGVTDEEVAFLPGGHTSKQLPRDFLLRREPDTLVLLLAPGVSEAEALSRPFGELPFARSVETRFSRLPGAEHYSARAVLPLGGGDQLYLVLQRVGTGLARKRVDRRGIGYVARRPQP